MEEPVLATEQLVLDEDREDVAGGQLLGLDLQEPGFEAGGHAGAAELAEGALELAEGLGTSWVFRAMMAR